MSKLISLIAVVAVVLAGAALYVSLSAQQNLGGQLVETDKVQFVNGFFAGADKQFEILANGTVDIGNDGTGTTTIDLNKFCIDYVATSTATPWKIIPYLNGLTAATTSPFRASFGSC